MLDRREFLTSTAASLAAIADAHARPIGAKGVALMQGGPAAPTPVISIQSGGGYAGSVYAADLTGGQWYADGVAIVGETSQTWTMTIAYEGAAITYRRAGKTSNAIDLWTPADDIASFAAWLNARDAAQIVLGTGSNVAQISDKTSNAIHAVQSTSANQPTWSATEWAADVAAVKLVSAGSQFMASAANALVGKFANSRGMWLTAARFDYATDSGSSYCLIKTRTATDDWTKYGVGLTYSGAFSDARLDPGSAVLPYTGKHLVGILRGASYDIYVDGTRVRTGAAPGNFAVDTLTIGKQTQSSNYFDGAYAEVLIFNDDPSAALLQRAEGYLAHACGGITLPPGHPYETTPPTA